MTLNFIKIRSAKIVEVNQWLEWDDLDATLESLGGKLRESVELNLTPRPKICFPREVGHRRQKNCSGNDGNTIDWSD